jgi:hypothetical protein
MSLANKLNLEAGMQVRLGLPAFQLCKTPRPTTKEEGGSDGRADDGASDGRPIRK